MKKLMIGLTLLLLLSFAIGVIGCDGAEETTGPYYSIEDALDGGQDETVGFDLVEVTSMIYSVIGDVHAGWVRDPSTGHGIGVIVDGEGVDFEPREGDYVSIPVAYLQVVPPDEYNTDSYLVVMASGMQLVER